PADMRSFMRSYRPATESNTPRTRRVFSSGATSSKPKWVLSLISCRVPACARRRHPVEIALPQLVLPQTEIVEVVPRVDASVVAVGDRRTDCVAAHGLDFLDRDVPLADLQHFLPRPMAADLGRRRIDAQEFVRQSERPLVAVRDLEDARGLVQLDLGGDRG